MAKYNYVYEWEGDTSQPFRNNYTWKSKTFLLPVVTNFSAARVIAEVGDRATYYALLVARAAAIKRNNARISSGSIQAAIGEAPIGESISVNGDNLETVPTVGAYSGDFSLSIKFYAGGVLKFTKDVYASDIPFRILGNFRKRSWEVEIEGNVTVRRFDMAQSMQELTETEV
jgi:hypothetical protein